MTEDELIAEAQQLTSWQQHKFMVLVALTIFVSLGLVGISLWLYNSSGAAQLDLSRRSYDSVRDKAKQENDFTEFSSSGSINEDTLNEFRNIYDKQLKEATAVQSFGGDVMSDDALGIGGAPTE